jgi:hypothetical protein
MHSASAPRPMSSRRSRARLQKILSALPGDMREPLRRRYAGSPARCERCPACSRPCWRENPISAGSKRASARRMSTDTCRPGNRRDGWQRTGEAVEPYQRAVALPKTKERDQANGHGRREDQDDPIPGGGTCSRPCSGCATRKWPWVQTCASDPRSSSLRNSAIAASRADRGRSSKTLRIGRRVGVSLRRAVG